MNDVTILDEKLLEQLGKAERPINFRGPDGKMFGFFTPLKLSDLQPQISDEEIQRRIADKSPGYTTAEVLKRLRGE